MKIINLSKINFLYVYINKLLEKNINMFDLNIIEKDFYNIINNYQYEFNEEYVSNKDFDLLPELIVLVQVGYLHQSKENNNRYYIIDIPKKETNSILGIYIENIFDIREICKKYKNLNIVLDNPNGNYNLSNDKINGNRFDCEIYTDGIKKNNYLRLLDSYDNNINIVNISNATYALKRGYVNDNEFSNNLYTRVIDTYIIDEIAKKYCKKR